MLAHLGSTWEMHTCAQQEAHSEVQYGTKPTYVDMR